MVPTRRGLDCPKYDQLIEKKRTKSSIWEHFKLPADDKGKLLTSDIAICIICKSPVSSKGGSTTNMTGHLRIHHSMLYSQIYHGNKHLQVASTSYANEDEDDPPLTMTKNKLQITVDEDEIPSLKRQKTMLDFQPLDGSSSKQYTNSITKFIVDTLQPYNIVEAESFKHMLKTFNPRYKIPGRKFFSNTAIPKLYNEVIEKIKAEISLVQLTDIAITTDCWTSLANDPYIAISAHFIDCQWNLKNFCLTCTHFQEDHTSENIANVLTDILNEWELDVSKLSCITADNGANIVKAATLLNVTHVPCFAHTINIGVNKALKIPIINRAVARLKKLQSTIAHSWKLARDLKDAQNLLKMQVVSLPSACPTRWWSILKLCRRFQENQLPLCKLLQDNPQKKHLMLEEKENKALEELLSTTNLLEQITNNLGGEKYTTISSVLPLLRKIYRSLEEAEGDSILKKEIKKEILSALERYKNNDLMTLLRLSSFCDPRFRTNFIDDADETRQLSLQEMCNLYSTEELTSSESKLSNLKPKSGLEILLEDDEMEVLEDSQPEIKAEAEMKNYLSMPKVGLNEDPLKWWKLNHHNFPSIKTLAKKYLTIPGSSVPSERIFSTGGNIITKNRASLKPKNSEMLIFLFQNKNLI